MTVAYSKATAMGKLTESMVNDAKHLLRLLGLPYV